MFLKKYLWKKWISILLSVIFTATSLITYPEPAFASNKFIASLEQQYLEDFICVKGESFPLSSFKNRPEGYLQNQAVKKLARQLGSCVKANRIPRVDLNNLINVAYTSEVDEENGMVGIVAAAGRKPSTPLAMSMGNTIDGVKVEIINFNNIDGSVFKVGTSLKIEAQARDKKGKNRDRDIVWLKNGKQIAKGRVLTYTPLESDITTLVASVNNSYTKVTFSSIPADGSLILPPGVTPLPTKPGASVISIDPNQPNLICFKDDPEAWKQLPTIKRGGTIIHFPDIPPRRVLEVKGNCLNTRITSADEFFPRTEKPFKFTDLLIENPDGSRRKLTQRDLETLKISFQPDNTPNNQDATKDRWVNLPPNEDQSPVDASVEKCYREAYETRYNALLEGAVKTEYQQENDNSPTPGGSLNLDQLRKPNEIMPPKGQFYQFDLKEALAKDKENETKQINTNYDNVKKADSNKFQQKAITKEEKLVVKALFGFDFQPKLKDTSELGYDIKRPLDGFNLKIDTSVEKEVLLAGLNIDALKSWQYCREDSLDCKNKKGPINIPTGVQPIFGPVYIPPAIPFWIQFPLLVKVPIDAKLQLDFKGVIGFLQTGYFNFDSEFDNRKKGEKWKFDFNDSKSINATVFCGAANISGDIKAAIKPTVQVLLWSVFGPEVGLEGWTKVKFDQPRPGVVTEIKTVGSQLELNSQVKDAVLMKITPSAGIDALMTIVTINEKLNKVLTFDVGLGKKKVCVPFTKICESYDLNFTFDLNRWLRSKFTATKNLKTYQREINAEIPTNKRPFAGVISGLFKNATILWHLDEQGAIASSSPNKPVTIDKSSLPPGKHKIRAEMYYSPFQNALEDKSKMVSDTKEVNL